jgi:Glycosyl hydrolase family 10
MSIARIGQIALGIAIGVLLMSLGHSEQPVHLSAADRGNVPSTLFNLNILGISEHTGWPAFPFAAWRNFHFKWQDLEPAKDQWDFARSDRDVQEARRHGVDIVAVVEGIPKWAASADDVSNENMQISKPEDASEWANYVRTMALRYKGQIHYYELWNEPETNHSFLREPARLIALNQVAYQTLKSVDPAIVVISSALSSGDPVPARVARNLDLFTRAGVMRDCDVVGYHPYGIPLSNETLPRSPEEMLTQIRAVKSAALQMGLQKPFWATEVGWYVLNDDQNPQPAPTWMGKPLEPELAAAYLSRTYVLGWAAGLDRIFWYCWRHGYMGLTEFNGDAKAPAVAYATVQRWLVGKLLISCDRNNAGSWLCQLKLANGGSEFIAWTEGKSGQLDIDPSWGIRGYKTLDGRGHELGNPTSVEISDSPILLSSSQ